MMSDLAEPKPLPGFNGQASQMAIPCTIFSKAREIRNEFNPWVGGQKAPADFSLLGMGKGQLVTGPIKQETQRA